MKFWFIYLFFGGVREDEWWDPFFQDIVGSYLLSRQDVNFTKFWHLIFSNRCIVWYEQLVLARFKDDQYKGLCWLAKEFKLWDIVAIMSLEVSLPKKAHHALEKAYNVVNVAVEKFICTKEGCCHEVTIPETGIS